MEFAFISSITELFNFWVSYLCNFPVTLDKYGVNSIIDYSEVLKYSLDQVQQISTKIRKTIIFTIQLILGQSGKKPFFPFMYIFSSYAMYSCVRFFTFSHFYCPDFLLIYFSRTASFFFLSMISYIWRTSREILKWFNFLYGLLRAINGTL